MEKEQQAEVLKTKDRRGATKEEAPIPAFSAAIVEDCRKVWCDGKRQFKVQIHRLSKLGVWVTVGKGPQCCNGKTFGPPIKECSLYCERVASQTIRESISLLAHRQSSSGSVFNL